MTLTITLDKRSEEALEKISAGQGMEPSNMASRLLQRAIRAAQPKPLYDIEALKAVYAEFVEEDIALSEDTVAEHAGLLVYEDQA